MTTPDPVERLLGAPDLARLVDTIVRRVEGGRSLSGRITIAADPSERDAIAALFGQRPRPGASISVDLDRLDEIVRRSGAAASLRAAIDQLRGPLVVRSERAEAVRLAWDAAHGPLDLLAARRPEFGDWVLGIRARGAVRRLVDTPDDGRRLLERVATVLSALPADGEALGRFAARVLGSAHVLDAGTPEAALVLSAAAAVPRFGSDPGPGGTKGEALLSVATRGARRRRELWASAGIVVEELSSTVLVHRLPLPGPAGELTRVGEPVVLTLRHVRALSISAPRVPVFVCENPSVVDAAARELGDAGPPLVCLQGQPSLAADVLLRQLAPAGLRYHGDFDWGGIRIANRLHGRFGFEPWRYRTADLERAADLPGTALKGTPVDALWDAALRPALERRATRLEEEQVLEDLLADLAAA